MDAEPIFDDAGDLLAIVETLRDITVQREAQEALRTLAQIDGLTGLSNRRTFDEVFDREFRQARRDKQPLSLLLVDVDHFKKFNDAAGHQAGDDCLRRIGYIIGRQTYRPGDQAARYGGEEFAIILANTNEKGAIIVANRILNALAAEAIPHPTSEIPRNSFGEHWRRLRGASGNNVSRSFIATR